MIINIALIFRSQVIHGVQLGEPEHIMKKRSIDQPLRILMFYDESVYR